MANEKPVVPAAAVILLRAADDAPAGFRVYLQQRAGTMDFMANRFVFPGGKVEPADGAQPLSPEALAVCAMRELWEEAGVLLALPAERAAALDAQRAEGLKRRVEAGELSLKTAWDELGLTPDFHALEPLARWITPPERSRRFDTTFYMAMLPQGQEAISDQRETTRGLWLAPAEALAENASGRVGLAPPQVRLLGELAACQSLDQARRMAVQADPRPVTPRMCKVNGRRIVLLPEDPDYPAERLPDPERPGEPCQAGTATRLVDRDDIWLPYRAAR